jgi:unspecific monooxygenase
MLELEPPRHTQLRNLVLRAFTSRRIAALEPEIAALATALAIAIPSGEFDLLHAFAQPLPVRIIARLLGVPEEMAPDLLRWSNAMVGMYMAGRTREVEDKAVAATEAFVTFLRGYVVQRRAKPADDLITQLIAAEMEGEKLSTDALISTCILLLNAGHEATVNSLANGMRAMMLHRDQWQRVTSGEVSPRTAIEDMIRWDAPLHLFERWVLDEGVVIAGQPMPVGAEVAMLFGAANRDPRRFDDPGRFDIGRGDTAHVGFGGGIHFCIGAPLARLELEVSLDRLARRLPDVELAAEPEYHPTFVIRGLTALHLTT